MKINPTIPTILLCLLPLGTKTKSQEACRLVARNAAGSTMGRIDPDGTIRAASGSTIGRFKDGTVRNASGATIGRIDPNGTIRDHSGSTIGRVEDDGDLRNASGSLIGKITPGGVVRNKNGATRGRFDKYVPACRHAAAAYLFFFEPLHNR